MMQKAQYPEYSIYAAREKFSKQMFIMLNYHRLIGGVSIIFGALACGLWALFEHWSALYGIIIALPPALLFGASLIQAIQRHEDILLRQRSRRKLLAMMRSIEPALYWCGLIGARAVCLVTFMLASVPSLFPITPQSILKIMCEIVALLFIMQGMIGVWCVVHFTKRIRSLRKPLPTTEILAHEFLAQLDLRKN